MRIVCHGGAGGKPDDPGPRQAVLDDAAEAGARAEDPVSAVETAINTLEDSPRFNAGIGGALQSDGTARVDAGIMTADRAVGAIASAEGVAHAVSAARVVLEETPHVLVTGDRAVDLARDYGVETDVELTTAQTRSRFDDAKPPDGDSRSHLAWLADRFGEGDDRSDHDTVGAVAVAPTPSGPEFAAATSTGGRWFALAGRVGDVPQVGSGFYAAPSGAASATGAGEDITRATLCRRAVRHLERGATAGEAAERSIEEFAELTGSTAGIIVIDSEGSGSAFNSAGMQTSRASDQNGS